MPERVHTKFNDELDTKIAAGGSSAPVQELQKISKVDSGPSREVQKLPSPPSSAELKGVKRKRDGSPKSVSSTNSNSFPLLSEVGGKDENGLGRITQMHEMVPESGDTDGRTIKDEQGVGEEDCQILLKRARGSSPTSINGSPTKQSGRFNGTQKVASSGGRTPQSTPRSSAANRVLYSRGSQRSSVESGDSKTSLIGPRPSQQALRRVRDNLIDVKKALPIWAHKADIRWTLRQTDVLLLVGETGSGKSTQVPQFLHQEPWFQRQAVQVIGSDGQERTVNVGGIIAITEPRRVAATSLARRVAQETGSYLGRGQCNDDDLVGYSVRFDTIMPRNAAIKFLTEGMLLQELLHDPHLRKYSAVIVDEIHERSVDVDLLAGFLRNIIRGDKAGRGGVPLKLVVMSATANLEGLQKFFSTGSSLNSEHLTEPSVQKSELIKGHPEMKTHDTNGTTTSHTTGVTGINGNSINMSDDPDTRRTSDASFSSWEGITSEDEKKGKQGQDQESSAKASLSNSKFSGLASSSSGKHPNKERNSALDLSNKLKDVVIHQIKGRQHPVKILYTPEPVADYLEATLKTIFKIHTQEPLPGDILAFLTGQEEIETLQELVEKFSVSLNKTIPKLKVIPLFGHQSIEQQQEAFTPSRDKRTRKVVLATNIAETSVTVPGVHYVVDCGKAKVKEHRVHLGLQSLLVKPISKSSAIQRKGRAGREAPGKCFRLYTEAEYLKLPDADVPEILRSDVVEAVLRMKARGVDDVLSFPLLDSPDVDAMERALLTLHSLGALDDEGSLSEIGVKMADFPLPAAYSRVLVAAAEPEMDCLLEIIDIIAALNAGDDIFLQPKSEEKREQVEDSRRELLRREGDILTYLTTIQKYTSENSNRSAWCEERLISSRNMKQAMNVRRQLRDLCLKWKMLVERPEHDPQPFIPMSAERAEILLKCFMKAFAMKTATLQPDGSYRTTLGKNVVAIHPSSVLHGKKLEAIMFLEHVYTQKNYAKKVSAIQMNWIAEGLEMA